MKLLLLLALVVTSPVFAREVQTLGAATPLTPTRYFLLKADGQNFKDTQGKPAAFLRQGQDTSQFTVKFVTRKGTQGERPMLELAFVPVHAQHHLSLDRQVAFLEVDGVQVPFINGFDSFMYRSADSQTEHLNLTLEKVALQRLAGAKKEVALKVRLYSVSLGKSGECATATEGSAKQRACTNAYTGAVFSGAQLQQLQATLKPFSTP